MAAARAAKENRDDGRRRPGRHAGPTAARAAVPEVLAPVADPAPVPQAAAAPRPARPLRPAPPRLLPAGVLSAEEGDLLRLPRLRRSRRAARGASDHPGLEPV